ncbi:hypothetical protein vseg_016370 [Gypsophila vaccaria]
MSRCFPFSPPGFRLIEDDNALIDSIKLHEERQDAIPDRVRQKVKSSDKKKDRKGEKKENKRDRKDRKRDEKEKVHSAVQDRKLEHSSLPKVDSVKQEFIGKQSFDLLERSNVTEEHGLPADLRNVSCSSDSTGNSGKRKRQPPPAGSIQGNGNIIRIRLSSQRKDEHPCTSGRTPSKDLSTTQGKPQLWSRPSQSIGQKDVMHKVQEPAIDQTCVMPMVKETSISQEDWTPKVQGSLHASASVVTMELVAPSKTIDSSALREDPTSSGRDTSSELPSMKLSSREKKMLKRESLYSKLFGNLVPPKLESEVVVDEHDDDDDWLSCKKDIERPAKRLREGTDDIQVQACMDSLSCAAFALRQPCAHILSNIGVYALPFTVPF